VKPDRDQITTVVLFKKIEELRVKLGIHIDDMADSLGVTPLGYKNWKNHGVVPDSWREPALKKRLSRLEKKYQSLK
jgi:DNA-binding transcriptional regulator YiaG